MSTTTSMSTAGVYSGTTAREMRRRLRAAARGRDGAETTEPGAEPQEEVVEDEPPHSMAAAAAPTLAPRRSAAPSAATGRRLRRVPHACRGRRGPAGCRGGRGAQLELGASGGAQSDLAAQFPPRAQLLAAEVCIVANELHESPDWSRAALTRPEALGWRGRVTHVSRASQRGAPAGQSLRRMVRAADAARIRPSSSSSRGRDRRL